MGYPTDCGVTSSPNISLQSRGLWYPMKECINRVYTDVGNVCVVTLCSSGWNLCESSRNYETLSG